MHELIVVASIRYPLHKRQVRILLKCLIRFLVIMVSVWFATVGLNLFRYFLIIYLQIEQKTAVSGDGWQN